MGGKRKYMILFAALLPFSLCGQDYGNFRYADSLTYKLYLDGRWDELIYEGRKVILSGTDYKFLRQRLGYAYYMKGDYTRSIASLSKALSYDSFDQFTIEYLSYAYRDAGKSSYAGVLEKRMSEETQGRIGLKSFRIADHADLELNYKRTSSVIRSDALYYRLGIRTKAGYRTGIYQSFSSYSQTINKSPGSNSTAFTIRQPEYYLCVSWNATRNMILTGAYHYLHTLAGRFLYPGHLMYLAISPDLNFMNFTVEQSFVTTEGQEIFQTGLSSTISFPGRSGFYLKGTLAGVYKGANVNIVYGPAAGLRLWKGSIAEGFFTTGGLDWYNDFNGLYVYNSYDPVSWKAGATLYQEIGGKTMIWFNYAYEKKSFVDNGSYGYNQFSFLGGIRWIL